MLSRTDVQRRVKRAVAATCERKVKVKDQDNLILSLQFNSLRIASLAIALEKELDQPLLLNEWIGRCNDPAMLTVASLGDYIWEVVQRNG